MSAQNIVRPIGRSSRTSGRLSRRFGTCTASERASGVTEPKAGIGCEGMAENSFLICSDWQEYQPVLMIAHRALPSPVGMVANGGRRRSELARPEMLRHVRKWYGTAPILMPIELDRWEGGGAFASIPDGPVSFLWHRGLPIGGRLRASPEASEGGAFQKFGSLR